MREIFLSKEEIEVAAAASWDRGAKKDGRPLWNELDSKQDGSLLRDMRKDARSGLRAFLILRETKRRTS